MDHYPVSSSWQRGVLGIKQREREDRERERERTERERERTERERERGSNQRDQYTHY